MKAEELTLKWKNKTDDFIESGGTLTELEQEMLGDIASLVEKPKSLQLKVLTQRDEGDGNGQFLFEARVGTFLSTHLIKVVKFQRNIFYSLSGDPQGEVASPEDSKKLLQEFVAFVVWEET